MPDPEPNPELLRSLGKLVRGLSALFWGLPVALIVGYHTARSDWFRSLGIVPPVLVTAWLFYGLAQLGHFQKQERVWRRALDRAKLLAVVNLGLSPFLFWWNKLPLNPFYTTVVCLLAITGIIFLTSLNLVLRRLAAMLPDEALRHETNHFTSFNRFVLAGTMILAILYFGSMRIPSPPGYLVGLLLIFEHGALLVMIFLVLLPLAMTMALLWKTKEVILESVFGAGK